MSKPILTIENLRTYFHTDIGVMKAVDDLTAAEKAEREIKAQTGFGFGAGGGGRAGGKGGTGKKGGSKKDESLFRILGRDLIKELKDIKKYNKK